MTFCALNLYALIFEGNLGYNKNYGLGLYLCTNEPEICDFMTNSKSHLHDIYKCDKCKDGYMIVKLKRNNAFYGCTGYDSETKLGCGNMRPIMKK